MNRPVSFHALAESELNEAARYYESRVGGLGLAFLAEVEHAIKHIQEHPEASPRILSVVHRKLLRRFPYSLMYSVSSDAIHILAVANQKRRPFYWSGRKPGQAARE